MLFLKLMAFLIYLVIAYQDIRDRMVTMVIFPLLSVVLAWIHISHSGWEVVLWFSLLNLLLVNAMLLLLFVYTRIRRSGKFLNHSIGLGDIFFFCAFAVGFPTLTFSVLFVGALLFSLFLFLTVKSVRDMRTVPLAGFMALFLIGTLILELFPDSPNLYLL